MRHHHRLTSALLTVCLVVSFGANADDAQGRDLADIRAQQIQLLAEVQAGTGIFQEMTPQERGDLAANQSRLLALIEDKGNVRDLDDAGQVEALNLLEQINAAINDVEGRQMVCELVRKTGSHRKTKECKTVAEREQMRENAQNLLDETRNGFCYREGQPCGG